MIEELRAQAELFRSLHEAESRKRTPYDHIAPRVSTGPQKRKMNPSLVGKAVASQTSDMLQASMLDNMISKEDYEKLEEVVNMLRTKLQEYEKHIDTLKWKLSESDELRVKERKSKESEIIALQVQVADLKTHEDSLRSKVFALESECESLRQSHDESTSLLNTLNHELKEERRRGLDLEHTIKGFETDRRELDEQGQIIQDLRAEKRLLEEEQERLLNTQFSRVRENELCAEIDELRRRLNENTRGLTEELNDKANIHSELERMRNMYEALRREKDEAYGLSSHLTEELEMLREKLASFSLNGELDLSEIEEALSMLRLKRERGISFEFLMELGDYDNERQQIQSLRIQNAECIQELEKTRKLLSLQEHINRDYKLEVEGLNRKMESIKNGYELRLEEDARLLDLRSSKISQLEAQLKNIVYGTAKGGKTQNEVETFTPVDLINGQNLIEIHLETIYLSDPGLIHLHNAGLIPTRSSITLFAIFDFFDFETVITPLGTSPFTTLNHTSSFRVFTDDFFLQYLQTQRVVLNVCVSNGLDFMCVGKCFVNVKELTDPDRTAPVRFYADLMSALDGKVVIGKVDYSLRAHLPMSQAIRAYKERTLALNLLESTAKDPSPQRTLKTPTNDLIIQITRCANLRPIHKSMSVFVGFQIYVFEEMTTETISSSPNPLFNHTRVLPIPMTRDLDSYLRHGAFYVVVLDERSGECYGSCQVPIFGLAFGEKICGEFDLFIEGEENSVARGAVSLSIEWARPYNGLEGVRGRARSPGMDPLSRPCELGKGKRSESVRREGEGCYDAKGRSRVSSPSSRDSDV
ncbi:Protein fantom [Dinochytrium kinnereticum]|nr:Protein fantom [Dinochytrium kinnereticum]